MQHTVSFVLPAFKHEFLAEAIRSILSQTYEDFELIIVNDASPYNLFEIVSQFKDSRIRYYENEKNLGGVNLTDSWNHAMKYTDAEYVVLASDDDIYAPEYLRTMMSLVDKYPSCDLFHCRLRYIDEAGNFKFYSNPALEYESCADFIYQRLFNNRKQAAPEFLFKRSALVSIGGFISFPIAWYSDDATWTALSTKGVVCAKEALLGFRMSGINLSTNSLKNNEKIEALYQYKKWLSVFLNELQVSTIEDQCILEYCRRYFDSILNAHLFLYLPYLPYSHFFKSILEAKRRKALTWRSTFGMIIRKVI